MKRPATVRPGRQRTLALGLLLVGLLGLVACQPAAADIAATGDASEDTVAITSDPIDEPADDVVEPEEAEEAPITRIEFGEWHSDLPRGVSRVAVGGGLINNGFPALSADLEQIAILYFAGHPMQGGYPTFELHSTATLELLERIDLFSEQEQQQVIQATGQAPNLRDQQIVLRIERLLEDINERLSRGGFQSVPQWYESRNHQSLESVERFDKRLAFYWDPVTEETSVTIKSLETGQVELALAMPRTEVSVYPDDPYQNCRVSIILQQAWYVAQLRVVILRMRLSSGIDSCSLPDQWILKRLGVP